MVAAIKVDNKTKQMLNMLKKNEEVDTYDEVLMRLIKSHMHIPESMFGAIKGLKFAKKDKLKLHIIQNH